MSLTRMSCLDGCCLEVRLQHHRLNVRYMYISSNSSDVFPVQPDQLAVPVHTGMPIDETAAPLCDRNFVFCAAGGFGGGTKSQVIVLLKNLGPV